LTDPLAIRVKQWENDEIRVMRIAEPVMYPNEKTVDANYRIVVTVKSTRTCQVFSATHLMQYLFKPEIELMLYQTRFQMLSCITWQGLRETDITTWNATFVARGI